MSAVCGVIGTDGRPWREPDLKEMLGGLGPVGRDGGGAWAGTAGRCGVALAARLRWSAPEDTGDRQPAQSRDGALVLVGDLRVDNRGELAGTLGLRDDRSVPDSAFVLAAYERWGDGFLDRVLGEFALAIVDRPRGGMLLARDHLGLRPLVVHERYGVVAFASNALALAAFEGVGRNLDVERAAEVLALHYESERTFVQGVRWLPPGSAMWVSDAGVRRWEWWRPGDGARQGRDHLEVAPGLVGVAPADGARIAHEFQHRLCALEALHTQLVDPASRHQRDVAFRRSSTTISPSTSRHAT